jgi:non-heme chloroperoxidase
MNERHSPRVPSPQPTSPEAAASQAPVRSEFRPIRLHSVQGSGGVELSVAEAGNPEGPAVLFVHGFCQSHQSWNRQLQSALGLDFRMVAPDLRGHGRSGKPAAGYADSRPWAEDLHAVITALRLERPVLVGWSYGGVVITDYLRHYGQESVAGVHFVGALSRLGKPEFFADLGPEFLPLLPAMLSPEDAQSRPAMEAFVSLLFHAPQAPAVRDEVLGYNLQVPHPVRLGVGQRVVDGGDVLGGLKLPVLVTHGQADRLVLPESGRLIASRVPHAELSLYPEVGHSPFWEDAPRFNEELSRFRARCR